jgi:hypothetical protein
MISNVNKGLIFYFFTIISFAEIIERISLICSKKKILSKYLINK